MKGLTSGLSYGLVHLFDHGQDGVLLLVAQETLDVRVGDGIQWFEGLL